jgi:hypothetical protein
MDAVEAAKSKEHSSPRPDFLGGGVLPRWSVKSLEKRRAHSPGAFLWYERLKNPIRCTLRAEVAASPVNDSHRPGPAGRRAFDFHRET